MKTVDVWKDVDAYFGDLLAPDDACLEGILLANARADLPPHDVSPLQGKLLDLMVRISGARCILEIGTLGGYSTICMARALPDGGRIITLEANPNHAEIALENFRRAGVLDRVDLRVGAALETLPMIAEQNEVFDLIFIDADKPNNPQYLSWALRCSKRGTIIIGDNVVRDGKVCDAESADPSVQGVRTFTAMIATEPRLSATAIQTVGVKGYDGFILARVL